LPVFDLKITVKSQRGECAFKYKEGDVFWVRGGASPEGLCMTALAALMPAISVLSVGGSFPWEPDPDSTCRACPDGDNPVVFEVRRIAESEVGDGGDNGS
jgi:uncharacterized repeat protein (TIGR04076 family)